MSKRETRNRDEGGRERAGIEGNVLHRWKGKSKKCCSQKRDNERERKRQSVFHNDRRRISWLIIIMKKIIIENYIM